MKKIVLSSFASIVLSNVAFAAAITLYTDPSTGQVFTTPGEGRVKMGDFIDANTVDTSIKQTESKVIKVQEKVDTSIKETETKVAQYQEKMDKQTAKEKSSWYNKLKINGYMQFRNTEWLEGEDKLNKGKFNGYWADKSTGNDSNFFIRRARLILSGDVGDHLGLYLQPDFGSQPAGANNSHFGQLRDFYGDVYIDKTKEHRIRIGQSKVPYGFENMQSSSKRLTLDRNDAFNSAVKDERDIGAYYYYTPVDIQNLFKEIDDKGLKHTGNYGMFALGAYNGQGANNLEKNGNNHIVSRLTYPWKTSSGQIYEVGIQGYTGKYVTNPTGTPPANAKKGIDDERIGISAIMYQQPFGLQAEWNWGKTPGADTASSSTTVSKKNLNGGYIQTMYRLTDVLKNGDVFTPFVKWQYFDGYQKAEKNSPLNKVNDWEIGIEWQIAKEVELSTIIHKMNRSDVLGSTNGYGERFEGTALRIQAQINY